MKARMKNCPFCRSRPDTAWVHDDEQEEDIFTIACVACGIPHVQDGTEAAAIDKWNRRNKPAKPKD